MYLTKSNEDYLETILVLEKEKGTVKSVDIAVMMNVSKPGVNRAMNVLSNLGLINKESYSNIELTAAGRTIANQVLDRHHTIHTFLLKLGVSKETAENDCCKIEHVISEETLNKIKEFIK